MQRTFNKDLVLSSMQLHVHWIGVIFIWISDWKSYTWVEIVWQRFRQKSDSYIVSYHWSFVITKFKAFHQPWFIYEIYSLSVSITTKFLPSLLKLWDSTFQSLVLETTPLWISLFKTWHMSPLPYWNFRVEWSRLRKSSTARKTFQAIYESTSSQLRDVSTQSVKVTIFSYFLGSFSNIVKKVTGILLLKFMRQYENDNYFFILSGVYFTSRVEHVKFVDFCGKYRLPLLQYLCSPQCRTTPAVYHSSSDTETDEDEAMANARLRRVLLG